ncbi:MAG: IPT/TIG domain-containing protein [Myxococcota bacterium]
MQPRSGALQGTTVKIHGANFRRDIGYTVYFSNKPAENVTILDDQTLAMIAPTQNSPGPVDVAIRVDDGSAWHIQNAFRYEDMGGNVIENIGARENGESSLPGSSNGKLIY